MATRTGRPFLPRGVRREFWRQVAVGLSTEAAGAAVGVAKATARKWFDEAGGMPDVGLVEPSGRCLSMRVREEIAVLHAQGLGQREIGRRLGWSASTINRELARNSPGSCGGKYRATTAQAEADRRARRPKEGKLAVNTPLRDYVQDRLAGPEHWSPEQIAHRLVLDFPDDEGMRISHETIYRSLYVQGRGELRRELTACLRTGRALRKPRRRADGRRERIRDKVMISERPAEVEDRAVPGHWEGDLILGKNNVSAIGTLVERTTRFTMLLHLPADHGAAAVRDAITTTIATLPAALRKTLTWDQGIELSEHLQLARDSELDVYFCDPHSPWQRATNENTNGLLRQYFPKGTDLAAHGPDQLAAVAAGLNGRPRKALDWKTPSEALAALLSDQLGQAGVASIP